MNIKEYNKLFSIIDIYYQKKFNNPSSVHWARWKSYSDFSDQVYCHFCRSNFYLASTFQADREICFKQILEHGFAHCPKSIKLFL